MNRPFDNTDGPITSPAMLAHLIDNTTRSVAPRRRKRQSTYSAWAWFAAICAVLYFVGRAM